VEAAWQPGGFFTDVLTNNQIQMPKILLYKLDSMYMETIAI
jgi:hypothetical protein